MLLQSTSSSRPSLRRKSLKISLWRKQSASSSSSSSSSSSNLKLPIVVVNVAIIVFIFIIIIIIVSSGSLSSTLLTIANFFLHFIWWEASSLTTTTTLLLRTRGPSGCYDTKVRSKFCALANKTPYKIFQYKIFTYWGDYKSI